MTPVFQKEREGLPGEIVWSSHHIPDSPNAYAVHAMMRIMSEMDGVTRTEVPNPNVRGDQVCSLDNLSHKYSPQKK